MGTFDEKMDRYIDRLKGAHSDVSGFFHEVRRIARESDHDQQAIEVRELIESRYATGSD